MFFVLIFIRYCVRIITGKGALILQNRSAFFILYFFDNGVAEQDICGVLLF